MPRQHHLPSKDLHDFPSQDFSASFKIPKSFYILISIQFSPTCQIAERDYTGVNIATAMLRRRSSFQSPRLAFLLAILYQLVKISRMQCEAPSGGGYGERCEQTAG
jgi:hypothetical protein